MNSKLSDAFLLFLIGPVSQPHKHHLSQGIIISQDIFKCLHLAWNSKTAILWTHYMSEKVLKNQTEKATVWQNDTSACGPNSPKSQSAWPGSDSWPCLPLESTFLNPSPAILQADGIPESQNETDTHAVRDPMPSFPESLRLTQRPCLLSPLQYVF